VHKYAEALTLVQYANIHLREACFVMSSPDCDNITYGIPAYYPLSGKDLDQLEVDLSAFGLQCRKDWFAYNVDSTNLDNKSFQKPLFFDIALNYVQLNMNHLQKRAGNKLAATTQMHTKSVSSKIESLVEKRQVDEAKVEVMRAETPEPRVSSRGGLGSLLGGWWS
jgi:signal recognition particle subunit SRP68